MQPWHGDADGLAPLPVAEWCLDRIPTAELTVVADAGHYLGTNLHHHSSSSPPGKRGKQPALPG